MQITTKFPQEIKPMKLVTFGELMNALPDFISPEDDIWIAGNMARYGMTTGNLIFLIDQKEEPSNEMRQYFNSLVESLGIAATVSNDCRNSKYTARHVYQSGVLQNKNTNVMSYVIPILTSEEVKEKSPKEVKWTFPIFYTGSVVKDGWSGNDFDIVVGEPIYELDELFYEKEEIIGFVKVENKDMAEVRDYFTKLLGWKTHVGQAVMSHKEPVYLYRAYN